MQDPRERTSTISVCRIVGSRFHSSVSISLFAAVSFVHRLLLAVPPQREIHFAMTVRDGYNGKGSGCKGSKCAKETNQVLGLQNPNGDMIDAYYAAATGSWHAATTKIKVSHLGPLKWDRPVGYMKVTDAPPKSCNSTKKSVVGKASGQYGKCVFPFEYGNYVYSSCAMVEQCEDDCPLSRFCQTISSLQLFVLHCFRHKSYTGLIG